MNYEQSDKLIEEQQETNRLLEEILKIMQTATVQPQIAKCYYCSAGLPTEYLKLDNKFFCSNECANKYRAFNHDNKLPQPN